MKADAWFRVYTRILDNPKLQTMEPKLFRQLVNFWALAKLNGGILPPINEIAWRLRRTTEEVTSDIEALLDRKLALLERKGKVVSPVEWIQWQTKKPTSTERVQRFRNKIRNDDETPIDDIDETHSETPLVTPSRNTGETRKRNTEEKRGEQEESIPPTPLAGGTDGDFSLQPAPPPSTGKRFVKPTAEEVTLYADSIHFPLAGQSFVDFYDSKGWKVGSTAMKDWRAAVRTWKMRRTEAAGASAQGRSRINPQYQMPEED